MASGNFSNYNITITIDIPNVSKLNSAINSALSGVSKTAKQTKDVSTNFSNVEKKTKNTNSNVDKLNTNLAKARRQSNGFLKDWERLTIVANQLAELTRKIVIFFNILMKPVSEAASFEQFRVTLKNLLGDIDAADNRFKEMVRFAAKTPFNVPGIVEAGNRLQAIGQYSIKTIEMLGDLAAASGKDVSQAIEAYTNLVVGRTGMAIKQFRALLISNTDWTREIGKQVLKNTGDVTASVQEMLDALPRIIAKKGFSKLMDEQSKTLNGIISNFEDAVQRTLASLGDKILPQVKLFYTSLIEFFDKLEKNATKVFKALKALGEAAKIIVLVAGFKQLSKMATVIRMEFIQLSRFLVSFKTSASTIGQSFKSLLFTLNLIKGTIQQSTIASIRWGQAIKVVGTTLATASRALLALLGKVGIAIFIVNSIVDLIKSAKNVFEVDLDERIENLQETIDLQKNYRDEQKEQLNSEVQRIKALEEVIRVEQKYKNKIKEKEKELKNANASEEQQKIVLQKTREEIEEYNTALDNLKSVYPDLIGKQNEFEFANKSNEITLDNLQKELNNSKDRFSKLKNTIISTTEAITNLRIELAKLNLEKQMKESADKITETLNQLPIFKDTLNDILNFIGLGTKKSTEELSKNFEDLVNTLIEARDTIEKESEKTSQQFIDYASFNTAAATRLNIQQQLRGLKNNAYEKFVEEIDDNAIKALKSVNLYLNTLDSNNIEQTNKQLYEMIDILNSFGDSKNFVKSFTTAMTNILKSRGLNVSEKIIEDIKEKAKILYGIMSNTALKIKDNIDKIKLQYADGFRNFYEKLLALHKNYLFSIIKDDKKANEQFKENIKNIQDNYTNLGNTVLEVYGRKDELEETIAMIPKELKFKDDKGKEIELKQYLTDELEKKVNELGSKFSPTVPLNITFTIPNLRDQQRTIDLVLNEFINKIDTFLEGSAEQNKAILEKRMESIKKSLANFKIKYEAIINTFKEDLEKINTDNISKKPVKNYGDFINQSFEAYVKAFKNLDYLRKEFKQNTKGFKEEIAKLEGIAEGTDLGLLRQFNTLTKDFSNIEEGLTKILSDTLKDFEDFVVNSRELIKQGALLPSALGFESSATQEFIDFLEGYVNAINKAMNEIDFGSGKDKLLKTIVDIYKLIDQLKGKLREEKSVKIKLDELFKILPADVTTPEKIKEQLENSLIKPLRDLVSSESYEIPVEYNIKPEISKEAKKDFEEIIKNDLNYVITKINNDFAKEDQALNLVIGNMQINNELQSDINKTQISEYKERIDYLTQIISLIRNTKTAEEEELNIIKERKIELAELSKKQGLTDSEALELKKLTEDEAELNRVLSERETIIAQLIALITKLANEIEKLQQKNKNTFGEKLERIMNDVVQVYSAVYDNLNKIGQTYFENMINNARKEAEIFLELQNKKIDADEKLAINYARTELQREKVRERMDEKRRQAQEKARKMELEARRKQFEFEKKMAVAQALINIAVAVTKIFAQTGTLGFIIAAGVEAFLNAVYIPMILSQEFPEYQKGGYTGDLKENEPAGIVHGKEFVVNAKATKKHRPLLEKINEGKLDDKTYKKGGYVTLDNSVENVRKLKEDINSISDAVTNIIRKEFYNNIKLKIETADLNKINIKGQINEFDKQIILSKNQLVKLPIVNNKINISNDSLLSEIKTLNNNLKYYLENPAPAIAYLNESEAEKITKVGFKRIQRKLI